MRMRAAVTSDTLLVTQAWELVVVLEVSSERQMDENEDSIQDPVTRKSICRRHTVSQQGHKRAMHHSMDTHQISVTVSSIN